MIHFRSVKKTVSPVKIISSKNYITSFEAEITTTLPKLKPESEPESEFLLEEDQLPTAADVWLWWAVVNDEVTIETTVCTAEPGLSIFV